MVKSTWVPRSPFVSSPFQTAAAGKYSIRVVIDTHVVPRDIFALGEYRVA